MPFGISPTQNLVRKAVFDILGDMSGLEFLDLYAGSGAVGLEAFSRGAKRVTLVEKDLRCAAIIKENIKLLTSIDPQEGEMIRLIEGDALMTVKQLAQARKKFDIVFFDPPFERGLGKKTLKTLSAYDILQPNCLVIIQEHNKETLPETEGRVRLVKAKNYGSSVITVYQDQSEL